MNYQTFNNKFRKIAKIYADKICKEDFDIVIKLLDSMKEKSSEDDDYANSVIDWFLNGSTLKLQDLLWKLETFENMEVLDQHNGLAFIDSARYNFNHENQTIFDVSI